MKKIFFICCITVSAFALSSSASISKHQNFSGYTSLNDTIPNRMSDTMKHNKNNKMQDQNNMNQDKMQNNNNNMNNMSDSGMSMKSDSTSTAPPRN